MVIAALKSNGCRVVILPFEDMGDDGHINLWTELPLSQARLAEVIYGMAAAPVALGASESALEGVSWASHVANGMSTEGNVWVAIPGSTVSPPGTTTLTVLSEFLGPALIIRKWGEDRESDSYSWRSVNFPKLLDTWRSAAEDHPLSSEAERRLHSFATIPRPLLNKVLGAAMYWKGSYRSLFDLGLSLHDASAESEP